jgi:hypothetical protein
MTAQLEERVLDFGLLTLEERKEISNRNPETFGGSRVGPEQRHWRMTMRTSILAIIVVAGSAIAFPAAARLQQAGPAGPQGLTDTGGIPWTAGSAANQNKLSGQTAGSASRSGTVAPD